MFDQLRNILLQSSQLLRDLGPTAGAGRQIAKLLVRSLPSAYRAVPVEGIRRIACADYSMEVPFEFSIDAAGLWGMRVAVACHIFYPDLAAEMLSTLDHMPIPFDLVISTDTAEKKRRIEDAAAGLRHGALSVLIVENRGRDIGPKLTAYLDLYATHDVVLFMHDKSNVSRKADGSVWIDGSDWRRYLLDCLIGSRETVASILAAFAQDARLGVVMPQHWGPIIGFTDWGKEFETARALGARMGVTLTPATVLDFPSGSMFWVRPQALRPLLELGLTLDDFPAEGGQIEGTIAHAIERLFLFSCEAAGFRWAKVSRRDLPGYSGKTVSISRPEDIARFQARRGFRLLGSFARRGTTRSAA